MFFSAVIFYDKVYIFLFLFFTFLVIKFPIGQMRSDVTHLKLKMRSNVVRPRHTMNELCTYICFNEIFFDLLILRNFRSLKREGSQV